MSDTPKPWSWPKRFMYGAGSIWLGAYALKLAVMTLRSIGWFLVVGAGVVVTSVVAWAIVRAVLRSRSERMW